ncbi:hypothetical protein A4X13_0g5767, partial [Tilletia indica]
MTTVLCAWSIPLPSYHGLETSTPAARPESYAHGQFPPQHAADYKRRRLPPSPNPMHTVDFLPKLKSCSN